MSDEQLGVAYRNGTRPRSREVCPSSAQLVDFAAGSVEDRSVADHLGNCSTCAEEYLALRAVAPRRRSATPLVWSLAAAALLLVTIGLAATSIALLGRNRDLNRAVARRAPAARPNAAPTATTVPPLITTIATNVVVIDLLPAAALVRGAAAEGVRVPPNAEAITAILNLDSASRFAGYGLEIADERGIVVWSGQGLQRSPHDTFAVHLPRSALPDGVYHFRLYGTRDGERTLIERYVLDLRRRQ